MKNKISKVELKKQLKSSSFVAATAKEMLEDEAGMMNHYKNFFLFTEEQSAMLKAVGYIPPTYEEWVSYMQKTHDGLLKKIETLKEQLGC